MSSMARSAWGVWLATTACGIFWSASVSAQERFIEDVLISRSGETATINVRLGCPMRYVAEVPTDAGVQLEVRMAPFDECRVIGGGIVSELQRPVSGRLAGLLEIEYESLGIGDGLLMLRFERPVDYRVTQRGDLRTLQITIDLDSATNLTDLGPGGLVPDSGPGPAAPATPANVPGVSADANADVERSIDPNRAPLRVRVVEPNLSLDYMINLLSTRDGSELDPPPEVAMSPEQQLYVSRINIDGYDWHRLRLGFFGSEADANAALDDLKARFPRAWIGRAEPDEIAYATQFEFTSSGTAALPVFAAEAPPEATGLDADAEPLAPEQVAELLEQGRQAMLDQNYAAAITTYTTLLAAPGDHRPTSREFLGLAYERSGDVGRARAEYQRYLEEFAGTDGTVRVRQRMSGLALRAAQPAAPLRERQPEPASAWEFNTGVSQYYRRDINQFDESQPEVTTLSALFSDIDFYVGRTGENIDFSTRLSFSHMTNLLDESDGGRGDQQRVSYAYSDIADADGKWSARFGRQSLHTWGVLGRFDGAHFAYDWAPDRSVHFTTGYPVESTRDAFETDRSFYGVAVEFDELIGDWDVAAFINSQTIDGIEARKAIGTEVRYFDDKRSFTGMLDYDVDFSELNTLLMLGTWRLANRMTLSVLFDDRLSPILTTRNALIGQPVETVDELLLVWTNDEIRQFAVDRTSESRTVTFGVATPLAERFQLNFDLTRTELGGTIASAGVAAIPDQGAQTYASTSLVGSGLFKGGDVNIFNLRIGESDTFKSSMLTWDSRFPIGRRIRINPRIRYSVWEGLVDGRSRRTISPILRFLMNTRNHYRIEFEVGVDRQMRDDVTRETESNGSFVNFGYRANF